MIITSLSTRLINKAAHIKPLEKAKSFLASTQNIAQTLEPAFVGPQIENSKNFLDALKQNTKEIFQHFYAATQGNGDEKKPFWHVDPIPVVYSDHSHHFSNETPPEYEKKLVEKYGEQGEKLIEQLDILEAGVHLKMELKEKFPDESQ